MQTDLQILILNIIEIEMNAFRKSNHGSNLTYSTNFIKKQAEHKSKKKFDK